MGLKPPNRRHRLPEIVPNTGLVRVSRTGRQRKAAGAAGPAANLTVFWSGRVYSAPRQRPSKAVAPLGE